jgi:hypothetical protein
LTRPVSIARHNHDAVLVDDEVLGGVPGLPLVARDGRAARVAVLLLDLLQLDADDVPAGADV